MIFRNVWEPVLTLRCATAQMRRTTRLFAQWNLTFAHLQFPNLKVKWSSTLFLDRTLLRLSHLYYCILTILPCADAHEYIVHFCYITILCLCFTNTPHSWMQLTLFLNLQKIAKFAVSPLKTGFTIYSNYRSWVNNNNWANIYPN